MKKAFTILILTLTLIMLATVVAAHGNHTLFEETKGVLTTTTHCPNCGVSGFIIYCNGTPSTYTYENVVCLLGSHGNGCMITNRTACVTYGMCTGGGGCHIGTGNTPYVYGSGHHVETVKHTYTGNYEYPVCIYTDR